MRTVATIALGTLVLLIPALINGAPFLFFDTGEYARLGRALAAGFRDYDGSRMWLTFLGGRAVSYSVLFVPLVKVGGFWLVATLQSLCGAFVLFWAARMLLPARGAGTYVGLLALLSAGTTAGLFAAFMMPDAFLAYALIASLTLVVGHGRLGRGTRAGLWLVLVFAISAHATNMLLMAGTLVLGVPAIAFARGGSLRRAVAAEALPVAALVVAVVFVLGAGWAIRVAAGEPLRKPPYLMARVLADGPGRAYLRATCGQTHWLICKDRDKPLTNQDDILWKPDPLISVFAGEDYGGRVRIDNEEKAFVAAAVAFDPIGEAIAVARNTVLQFVKFDVADQFEQSREAWDWDLRFSLPGEGAGMLGSRAYNWRIDWPVVTWLDRLVVLAALLLVAVRVTRPDFRAALRGSGDEARAAFAMAAGLGAALIVNAALCGALSGPSDRYQARLIWTVPVLAGVLLMRFGWRGTARTARS